MLSRLIGFFLGSLPPAIAKADTLLTQADRQAVLADLAHADAAEAGLGEALATYVVAGEEETALLRLDTLLQSGHRSVGPAQEAAWEAVWPHPHPYGDKAQAQKRRLEERRRVLFGLESLDPGAMRRYGIVLSAAFASQHSRYAFPGTDRSPMWLRTLLHAVLVYGVHDPAAKVQPYTVLTAQRLREMLAAEGASLTPLVDCVFAAGAPSRTGRIGAPGSQDGLVELLADEAASVPDAVRSLPAAGRAAAILYCAKTSLLRRSPVFLDLALALAADGSKAVREAALATLLEAPRDQVRARAAEHLASASTDDRLAAVNALAGLGAEAQPLLDAHAASETSKKVLQALAAVRATAAALGAAPPAGDEDGPEGYAGVDGQFVAAPPLEPASEGVPDDTEAVFGALIAAANAGARRDWDALTDEQREQRKRAYLLPQRFKEPFDLRAARQAAAVMSGSARTGDAEGAVWAAASAAPSFWGSETRAAYVSGLRAFLDRPEVGFAGLVRLSLVRRNAEQWLHQLSGTLAQAPYGPEIHRAIRRRIADGADFRHFVALSEAEGFSMAEALEAGLGRHWFARDDIEGTIPTVWPVLARHFPILDKALAPGAAARAPRAAEGAVALLRFFPVLPRRYLPAFLDRAMNGPSAARAHAREVLRQAGDLTPVIAALLRDGEAKQRIGGARWLADRRDGAAVPALREALGRERNEKARAAILSALTACGDDISDQFSEEGLLAEARAGLPKAKTDYSALFDPAHLPFLRWADGRPVPPEVVRWWFARAHKLKQPGGDPLLHLALDRLDRGDAAGLGQAVLSAFIQYDTRHPSAEEANAYARANAPNWKSTYIGYRKAESEEEAFAHLRRTKLAEYLGSALDHRGLLALARHAPAAAATAMVKRYLRDHGSRANQCRALIDALAANPAPAALQLILAASQRHKQPGARKHAAEVTAAIAEERGWTPAELADRTIPSAGLDEDGVLELPIGDRAYRARIADAKPKKAGGAPGLTLVVENPDGKPVSALPTPSDPAEAEAAKEARKALSAAKKELAQTVELQTARLYEAMCAGHAWPAGDFQAYLLGHPIVGRLLRRLVLAGYDADGKLVSSFRALDDGSLTDAEDAPVRPDGLQAVGIAHAAVLGPDAARGWAAHLRDYEVAPLFDQLGRTLPAAADPRALELRDREGWMIDTFTLRSAATALGYQRGPTEDGGWFASYDKLFPELGVAASIAFTGAPVSEAERHPGALKQLSFLRIRPGDAQGWSRRPLALGKVPPVLLSEAWNDLHAIAAQGTGWDPDWQKAGW